MLAVAALSLVLGLQQVGPAQHQVRRQPGGRRSGSALSASPSAPGASASGTGVPSSSASALRSWAICPA